MPRRTLALRFCAWCTPTRYLGWALWPWSGSLITRTHGMCADCARDRFGTEEAA